MSLNMFSLYNETDQATIHNNVLPLLLYYDNHLCYCSLLLLLSLNPVHVLNNSKISLPSVTNLSSILDISSCLALSKAFVQSIKQKHKSQVTSTDVLL